MSKERTFEGESGDRGKRVTTNYDDDINAASRARNNQRRDTDPMIEKEGYLGVDDVDRLRRRKIIKNY